MNLKPDDTRTATRRRGPELEDAILDAAWQVLVEQSYAGFTYEAISARAATSRPVLYRRWPHRDDLLLATLRKHWWSQPIVIPDTGSLREDVIGLLLNANAARSFMATLVGVQLMDYFRQSGSNFNELRALLRDPDQTTAMEQIVARAVERRELPDVPRSARVVNLPFDLFRHDLFMSMRAVPESSISEIVDEVWLPLIGRPSNSDKADRRKAGDRQTPTF